MLNVSDDDGHDAKALIAPIRRLIVLTVIHFQIPAAAAVAETFGDFDGKPTYSIFFVVLPC